MNEEKIRGYIRSILNEASDGLLSEKKKMSKIQPGEIGLSVGRGAFTKVVADAGALAKENPKQLMKNLQIDTGGQGLDGVVKILRQAFNGTDVMDSAYGGLSKVTSGNRTGIEVSMGELNARNGAKFLHHTLKGAQSAGLLSSNEPLQIQVVGDGVVIHNGEHKGDWE
tara:strand:+ start:1155 stop:1658 length:504 start_codon:yes stop_codon:yes gene_type:complete